MARIWFMGANDDLALQMVLLLFFLLKSVRSIVPPSLSAPTAIEDSIIFMPAMTPITPTIHFLLDLFLFFFFHLHSHFLLNS
jgi:hypothetical protein